MWSGCVSPRTVCSECPCETPRAWARELPLSNKNQIFTLSSNPHASMSSAFRQIPNRDNMKNQRLLSSVYATLVLSACFLQGYSLPQPEKISRSKSRNHLHYFIKVILTDILLRNTAASSAPPPRTSATASRATWRPS